MKLLLPYPPSVNRYWRHVRGHVVVSEEARRYKAAVRNLCLVRRIKRLDGPLTVTVTAYRPRRIGDLDNLLKVLFDALNCVAWNDDDQVVAIHAARHDDKLDPRVEVEVESAFKPHA